MIKSTIYQIKRRIQWSGRLLIMLAFLFSPILVSAEENLSFYVTPEFPESQVEGSGRYFDLNSEPRSTEELTLKIQNANDQAKTIEITAHTAFTNVQGVVEYGKDAEKADPTLPYSLADLIEPPVPIELAGNETKTVKVMLNMPKEAFSGFLAGGLRIAEVKEKPQETETSGEGVAIKNEFAYVVGVVVSNDRSAVKPDLDLLDVFADQLNYRNVISANLQNFTPTFVNHLEVEATVQKEGENDILYRAKQEQMQMAPNSNFNFPISLEGDRFRSGDYVLKMTARSGEEEWQWERKFTIEADTARALNQQDVTIDTSINWWLVTAVILILFLLLIIVWLLNKKQRAKNKEDQ
ncbi:DUF916 and DUF3324 domain-containing protein [Enterococcus mundtii]|uniref:DUF916 and DUF3324 domain-containing protein n=1 Tax=Enterococcus mundtii TaxID=53346 RepID=UPI0018835E82|nr:DUF916 and DUF3324 domain-containing protein [Enterococcus mundtii]MBE9911772.1 DUF916 and DUF3324 domain-containing protein [Enterococcus mundtii]UBM05275.1 DUF916 and DUF3324 domain-containing protein [Enterococcus mundtii]